MNGREIARFCVAGLVGGIALLLAGSSMREKHGAAAQPARDPFAEWDKDGDGYLTREEFPARLGDRLFDQIDEDGDGLISRKEDDDFRERRRGGQPRGPQGPELPPGAKVDRNIVYARVGDRDLLLDLYRPGESPGPLPVVLWVHGGGWQQGSKDSAGPAIRLVGRGYAVVSVGYRLSGEAIFPAAIEDCKAAVRWVRAKAAEYGLDADHLGAWGSSAGGHLVALMGTTGDTAEFGTEANAGYSSRVQAVCDWFGPTDFLRMNDFPGAINHDGANSPESRFIGGPIQENQPRVARANPITYVSEGDPPFLIMHGENDQAVPYNQSELLCEALQACGVEATLYQVKGGGHGFTGATEDTPAERFEMACRFFDRHLKKALEPGAP